MRLLLVTNDWLPDIGGIQTYLAGLVERTSHDVTVLGPANPIAEDDPMVVRHPDARFLGPTPSVRRWIVDEARRAGADLVWFGAPHPPALVGPELGLPYVVHVHGAEVGIADSVPGLRTRLRSTLRQAADVLSVSRWTADEVERRVGRPATVVGVGVDVDRFSPGEAPDRMVVLCVGRLVPRKGQARVIEAVARLGEGGVAAEVVIVGAGRDKQRLRELAIRRGVRATFPGAVPDAELTEWYRSSTVFAMPVADRWAGREFEGLGIVYLEAAASGLPVIVGPSGGAPETIIPGETGFIADDARTLARQFAWIAAHRDEARAMGASGRAFVTERYGWDAVVDRFDTAITRAAAT